MLLPAEFTTLRPRGSRRHRLLLITYLYSAPAAAFVQSADQ